jgi:hypothetical protein
MIKSRMLCAAASFFPFVSQALLTPKYTMIKSRLLWMTVSGVPELAATCRSTAA